MEFKYDGGGLAKGGDVTLYYDGKAVGAGRVEQTQPMGYSADEALRRGLRHRVARVTRLRPDRQPLYRGDRVGPAGHRRGQPRPPDHTGGTVQSCDGTAIDRLDTDERGRGSMTDQPDRYEIEVFDSNSMDWLELPLEQLGRSLSLKPFTFDPDTGMSCMLLRYDAGFINPWHTHHCAHGMFVSSGTLRPRAPALRSGELRVVPRGDDSCITVRRAESDVTSAVHYEQAVQHSLHIRG